VAPTLDAGSLFAARYRLDRKLGQGGMGVVWAATDTTTERLVALKVLVGTDDEAKRRDHQLRLRREARAASAVVHPNLRAILDVLELDDGSPALVMEYLEGESLAGRLDRDGRMDLSELAPIFVQIVAGVQAVHAHRIVHRDLKPENVFLVRGAPASDASLAQCQVKVLDFGIAKLTATEGEIVASTALTATGAMLGTPCYMSPEQFGERDIDHRTDVWSLGLIAYRCLSGVLPTHGEHIFEVFRKVVDRPVPPLSESAPGLPEDVTELVGRMLQRNRDARLDDLREVLDVFARHVGPGDVRSGARPISVRTRRTSDRPVDVLATTHDALALAARGAAPSRPGADERVAPRSSDAAHPVSGVPISSSRRVAASRLVMGAALGAATLAGLWLLQTMRAPPAVAPLDRAAVAARSGPPATSSIATSEVAASSVDVASPPPSAPAPGATAPASSGSGAAGYARPRPRQRPPAAESAPSAPPSPLPPPKPIKDELVKEAP
jgi:serine/threonine protein kinase